MTKDTNLTCNQAKGQATFEGWASAVVVLWPRISTHTCGLGCAQAQLLPFYRR